MTTPDIPPKTPTRPLTRGMFARVPRGDYAAYAKELCDLGVNTVCVDFEDSAEYIERFKAFVKACRAQGLRVFVITGPRGPYFRRPDGKLVRFCLNSKFSNMWAEYLKKIVRLGVDGISVAPDEFRWERDHVGDEFGEDRWPWLEGDRFCYCGRCIDRFREEFKSRPPMEGVGFDRGYYETTITPWVFGSPHHFPSDAGGARNWVQFRYRTVAEAMRFWSKSVKEIDAKVVTMPLLNMASIAVDRRYPSGVAWDVVGLLDAVDGLCANPYIGLHPYYEPDLDHYYVPETVKHLLAASTKKRATVVLSATSLRPYLRPLRGIEVYGSALSAAAHGAEGVMFFHHALLKQPDYEANEQWCQRAHRALKTIEPLVDGSAVPGDLVVLMSRRSEDHYALAPRRQSDDERRYGFRCLEKLQRMLLQNGYPYRVEYLEHMDYDRLGDCKVLVAPFLYSLSLMESRDLAEFVAKGHSLLAINHVGETDVMGNAHHEPVLLELLGISELGQEFQDRPLAFVPESPILGGVTLPRDRFRMREFVKVNDDTAALTKRGAVTLRKHGNGVALYLGGDFAARADQVGYSDVLRHSLDYLLERHRKLALHKPHGADIEAALRIRPDGAFIVFLINWDSADHEVQLGVNVPESDFAVQDWLLEPTTDLRLANEYSIGPDRARQMKAKLPPESVRILVLAPVA